MSALRTAVNLSIDFDDAPGQTTKIVQADTISGFVGDYPPGLPGFHGCGYAAVDEGLDIITADSQSHPYPNGIYL